MNNPTLNNSAFYYINGTKVGPCNINLAVSEKNEIIKYNN
jgi:hypothetical protein